MKQWPNLRGFIQDHAFTNDLATLGISVADFDGAFQADLEEVLSGASDGSLDEVFPTQVNDLRMAFTDAHLGVPPLRIAFRVAVEDFGKIELCRCSLR